MDFCFENADIKGKNLVYVLWLGMAMSVLMFVIIIYLRLCQLPEIPLNIPTKVCKVCVKKY